MEKFTCIIVDDVEIDRLMVTSYVSRFTDFNIIGVFSNAKAAMECIDNNKIDIIFLDIDLPDNSGIDIRKKALEIPVCIFITSHPEFAVESFELETLDYILKPVNAVRFCATVKRIEDYMTIINKISQFESSIGGDFIFIKEGTSETKVNVFDIYYLEALKNYTLINTNNKQYKVLLTIGQLLKDANFSSFIRIHRGFAVQKNYIEKITAQEVILNNAKVIPIGRSYKENLNAIL